MLEALLEKTLLRKENLGMLITMIPPGLSSAP